MRILAACSLGGAGHLNPLLPFLSTAMQRGDEVLVVAPPALGALVESAGCAFTPGAEPPEEMVAAIREQLPVVPAAEASVLGNRELFGRLATRAMLPAMEQACADWHPDLVLREPCEYASAIIAAERRIPVAQVAISLAGAEEASIRVAAPVLDDYREGLTEELWTSPYLTRFPASLDPSPFLTTVRYREPFVRPEQALPDWWDGADGPLIYVTFGTVLGHMSMAARVYQLILQALEDLEVRVLLTVGQTFDVSALDRVPANVRVERWIEQARALASADVVLCHAGSGTALGALSTGTPLVMVPLFADQFENARRIAAIGAGTIVEVDPRAPRGARRPIHEEDVPRITEEINRILAEPSYRHRARAVADEMAAAAFLHDILDGVPSLGRS